MAGRGVTPSGLKRLLASIGADRILVLGPPGVGKSTVIREYAEERAKRLGLRFVDVASLGDPEEVDVEESYLYLQLFSPLLRAEDLAFIARRGSRYDWTLPRKLELFTFKGSRGLIFIDEITNTQLPDVQTMLFSMILDKRIAHSRLSDDVEIVAAGNHPEESSIAVALPEPLVDRFRLVVRTKPPSVDEWIEWMASQGRPWDRRIAAFLRVNPEMIYVRPEDGSLEKAPTPRSWSQLAWDLASAGDLDGDMLGLIVEYSIGKVAASRLLEFLEAGSKTSGGIDSYALASLSEEERLLSLAELAERVERERDCGLLEAIARLGVHYLVFLLSLLDLNTRLSIAKCRVVSEALLEVSKHA